MEPKYVMGSEDSFLAPRLCLKRVAGRPRTNSPAGLALVTAGAETRRPSLGGCWRIWRECANRLGWRLTVLRYGTLRHCNMAPYSATEVGISAALLSMLQLKAARARTFELGHKSTVLNCIGHGEMLFAASNS